MSVETIKNKLKNKEQRVSVMDAAADVSWMLQEFLACYTSKKNKMSRAHWQNKFIKKALKLMLKIQPLIEDIDINKISNELIVKMVNDISNYPFNDDNEINLYQVTVLLAKYYVFFPYIYMELCSIYLTLKDDDQILSITELRDKVLKKYLPKILNVGPNVYKAWNTIKSEKTILNDFDLEFSRTMDSYILNYVTPEELQKIGR